MDSAREKTQAIATDQDQVLGRELVRTLLVAIKIARTHGCSNEAGAKAVRSLLDAIGKLTDLHGRFTLSLAGDQLFVDRTRLRVERSSYSYMEMLISEFTSRSMGSLSILDKVSREDLERLLNLLVNNPVIDEDGVPELASRLESTTSCFSIGPANQINESGLTSPERVSRRERCKKAFFKAVTVSRAIMNSVQLGKRPEFHNVKRVVQQMVDLMMQEEFTLVGLTTLKTHDAYTFYHSVNVCIYCLALGNRIGMNRNQLTEVGVGALLHDLGKAKVPREILNKKGALSPSERETMRKHPEWGVKELLVTGGLSSLAFRSMTGAFEHHLYYDSSSSGYPSLRGPYRSHVVGRMVAIADVFDAMTTKRVYSKRPPSRDEALSYLMSQAGTRFDPVLVRVFANLIGAFPVGTAVRLKSGRLAVVIASNKDPKFCARPIVRPITDKAGIQLAGRELPELDLSKEGPDGSYPDEIVAALDAEAMGIDTSRYYI